jgi:putative multicomponent Na+:H+ antiporter subunit B
MCLPIAPAVLHRGGIFVDSSLNNSVAVITALLPFVSTLLMVQRNPYHALVIRGILGAVAALVYTILGAADVALTEALVGTLLAIALYAVAVRSSLVLRLGVLKDDINALEAVAEFHQAHDLQQVLDKLRHRFAQHYMQVELVPYLHPDDLQQALRQKEIHATCMRPSFDPSDTEQGRPVPSYQTITRVSRLYEILQAEPELATTYIMPTNAGGVAP